MRLLALFLCLLPCVAVGQEYNPRYIRDNDTQMAILEGDLRGGPILERASCRDIDVSEDGVHWYHLLGGICFQDCERLGLKPPHLPDTVNVYANAFLPALLADWDAYRAECYNDSTLHDRRNDGWTYGKNWLLPSTKDTNMVWRTYGGNGIAVTEAKLRWYWTHREPTLEGFMQFLRRKVK